MTEKITIETLDEPATTRRPAHVLRPGFGLLAAGAGAEAVARVLYVPWWDDADRYIGDIVAHRGVHLTGAVLSFAAAIVITVAISRLWAAANTNRTTGTALTAALLFPVGLAAGAAIAFLTGSFAADADRAAAVATWQDAWTSAGADLGWWTAMLGALALTVAVTGLARRRTVPRIPAALIGLGALATAVTSAGPVTAILVTAALLLVAGAGWAAAKATVAQ
ncbi:hypothetical protein RB614_24055 [Phytohabitans sp. ZYX-F-186]|uniref:Uncharacterized protein n=1 Tax=Phytohabitans maris TaxID=3071409 RepID=A0ABU0ZMI0_9ACTN|nr:hypothetical protein [Phytohabitans sp. ZYX-F-186]MDQ7907599.1 hypothetical protein [Phytohabitans sp. ZYX-F-186]